MVDVARISLGDLQYYRETLGDIAAQARSYVYDAVEASGGGVTAMREAAIEALQDSVGIHGEMAQAWAGQLFDEVCALEGMGPFDFQMFDDIIDFAMLEDKVRYFAKALVEGDRGRYLDDCSQLADFYAWRCNYEGMVRNCYHNHVRYARIPTGTDTCDFCLMLASRGFVYYDQAKAEEGSHMHCVVAGTRVFAYDLLGAESRHYQGPLVHIVTASGNDLTITPNHPVLTTNGWVAAGEVNDGDYLVCAGFDHGCVSGTPYEHHVQPKVEDVFGALCFLNPSGLSTMPTTAEDFHGDATEGVEVNVVRADGLLEDVFDIAIGEPFVHEDFESAVLNVSVKRLPFLAESSSDLFHERNSSTTGSIMSGLGLSGALGASHLRNPDSLGVAVTPTFDTSLFEPSEQCGTGYAVALGKCKQTLASFVPRQEIVGHGDSSRIGSANLRDIHADSLEVLAKSVTVASEPASDGGYGFPIPIEISRVVYKSVSVGDCHVYNLTTSTSWYFANNIITHNCDCIVVPGNGADATSPTQVEGYDPKALYDLWQDQISEMATGRAERNKTSYQIERMKIMDGYKAASRRARKRLR